MIKIIKKLEKINKESINNGIDTNIENEILYILLKNIKYNKYKIYFYNNNTKYIYGKKYKPLKKKLDKTDRLEFEIQINHVNNNKSSKKIIFIYYPTQKNNVYFETYFKYRNIFWEKGNFKNFSKEHFIKILKKVCFFENKCNNTNCTNCKNKYNINQIAEIIKQNKNNFLCLNSFDLANYFCRVWTEIKSNYNLK